VRFVGSTILITGAASGIGFSATQLFANEGAEVIGVDRDVDAIHAANETLATDLHIRRCDVSNVEDIEALIRQLTEERKLPNIVVNNAAVLKDQTLASKLGKKVKLHSIQDWHETLNSNLTGSFLVARAFAAAWIGSKTPGLIINTSSVVRGGNAGQSAYSATKAAVDALTVTWANELSIYNIRVAGIAYGFAETGMTENIPQLFRAQLKKRAQVKRFADAAELVHGLKFIISNDYFSGRILELDGGMRF
jgi:3-oxoacyl-[acyl-carrier protein] reductase